MIRLTRFDGTVLLLNTDRLVLAEAAPDTVLTLAGGDKILVREDLDLVLERFRAARHLRFVGPGRPPEGEVVA